MSQDLRAFTRGVFAFAVAVPESVDRGRIRHSQGGRRGQDSVVATPSVAGAHRP